MSSHHLLNNARLSVSQEPPYDVLQAFVRDNHIALKGTKEGPLSDLVFAAKDVFKILGSTWGNGHPEWLRNSQPDEFTSSTIVKLLNAGADLVGKTICDELCFSISGENWNYGNPVNPHDPRRLTGGSSSGSGAAAGGGLVDFSLGSDCLGSVRVPASYNGVFGMRPTYKRIPNDGEAPYCESMDVLGFMAKDPQIFKRVSRILLEEDDQSYTFKHLWIAKDCFDAVNQDVAEALQPAVKFIGNSLESVKEVTVAAEGLDHWVETFRMVQGYEVWESYGGFIRKYRPQLSPGPKERLKWASTITLQEYRDALEEKKKIETYMEEFLPANTLLVLPTAASVAPLKSAPLEEINATRAQSSGLLCISPLTGIPQLTLPMIQQYNVPLGITLLGAKGTDLSLVNFGADIVSEYWKTNA